MAVNEKIAVSLAQDVYRDTGRPPLPRGWSIFYNCTEEDQKDGYFGAAYQFNIDPNNAAIVIAHRGTYNIQGGIEDFKMWAFNTVPAQFYNGAMPFILDVFYQLDQSVYNQTRTSLYFTGHSLGATLSELSIPRYIHYFDGTMGRYNPYRVWGDKTYVFESPGAANLISEQLANGEITTEDIKDGSKTIQVYNSEVNAINTCMLSSASYGRKRIFAAIGNRYSCLSNTSYLSYYPTFEFYAHDYTLTQHSMGYLYNWVHSLNPAAYSIIKVSEWPIGNEDAYYNYLSYYAIPNPNFENHNRYWEQYTTILWNQDQALHKRFNNDLYAFQDFYYKSELHYIGPYYVGNIDLSTFPSSQGFVLEFPNSGTAGYLFDGLDSLSGIGDVNRDSIPDLLIGLSYQYIDDSGLHWIYGESAYVVYGGQSGAIDLSSFPNKQGFVIKGGDDNMYAGRVVSGTGDINGDGLADFMVTAGPNAYLIYGGQSGIIDLTHFSSNQGFTILNTYCNNSIGPSSISGTGDVNGDEIPDLLLGFPETDTTCHEWYPSSWPGTVYVVYGGQSGTIDLTHFPNNQGFVIRGIPNSGQVIGYSISGTGDINGDRIPDLLISSRYINNNFETGAYVVYGGQSGTIELKYFPNIQGFVIKHTTLCDGGIPKVSGTGDINGDSIPDLSISITCGDAFLVYGGQNGVIDLTQFPNSQGFRISISSPSDDPISGLGDVNGDGVADLLLGCGNCLYENLYTSTAYVIYGGHSGTINTSTFPSNQGFMIGGELMSFPFGMSGTGDINRDGLADILVGLGQGRNLTYTYVSSLVYGRHSPLAFPIKNNNADQEDNLLKKNLSHNSTKTAVSENKPLSFSNMAGKQFNVFYQQAKEYLASFWRANWYISTESKERVLSVQEQRRLDRLTEVQTNLDQLEYSLKTIAHDNEPYLTKVLTFYRKMVTEWQENVVEINAQDIRDLQADIATIKDAVYLAPLFNEFGIEKVTRKSTVDNSVGFFAQVNTSFAANQPALAAAQPLRALP